MSIFNDFLGRIHLHPFHINDTESTVLDNINCRYACLPITVIDCIHLETCVKTSLSVRSIDKPCMKEYPALRSRLVRHDPGRIGALERFIFSEEGNQRA